MKIFKMQQVTPEWYEARRGVPTASEFGRICTPAKGEPSKQMEEYACELVGDLVCLNPAYFTEKGGPVNSYAIQNGLNLEPHARRWLAFDAGLDVHEVGFCMNDDFTLGCSPDGLLGLTIAQESGGTWNGHPWYEGTAEAVVELKCPLPKTQAQYLLRGELPVEYRPQVHGHLLVTGAKYVEFVSYSDTLAPLRVRVEPDAYTEKLRAALVEFSRVFADVRHKLIGK